MMPPFEQVIRRLLYTTEGQTLVSVIFGVGLASIFRRACKDHKCRVVRPAPLSEIEGRVFKTADGKCVRYVPYPVKCERKAMETMVGDDGVADGVAISAATLPEKESAPSLN